MVTVLGCRFQTRLLSNNGSNRQYPFKYKSNSYLQLPVNPKNLGVKLRQQTTVSCVVKKVIGDGHALKESNHTTEDQTEGHIYTYFTEALTENYRGEQKTGEYEESDAYISMKSNLKKHLSFWENTIGKWNIAWHS